jgi:proteasome lid subunit RPN8/RPN11
MTLMPYSTDDTEENTSRTVDKVKSMNDPLTPAVVLPQAVYEAIVAHSREGKPEEVCGVVRGRGLEAYEAIRGENIAPERIENYEVDPQTLLRQFDFEDSGEEMMGIYHSHPVSVAFPSATDAWNAHYPDSIYLICSLENDEPVIRAFRLTPHFVELTDGDLDVLRQNLEFYQTRRHLFAYFHPPGADIPTTIKQLIGEVPSPFYIVIHSPDYADRETESRIVSVVEHPVEIV